MRKLTVGVVADFKKASGVTRFIDNSFLKVHDFPVQFVAFNISGSHELDEYLLSKGWEVEHIVAANESYSRHIKTWYVALHKHRKLDVLYFNYSAAWNVLPVIMGRFLTNARIAVHSHNVYFGTNAGSLKLTVLKFLHLFGKNILHFFVSYRFAASKEAASWLFPNRDVPKVQIINNGVDLEALDFSVQTREKIRKKYHILPESIVIGNVGVLQSRKNQKFLLEIFSRLVHIQPNSFLWIIGDGELKSELQSLAKTLGIADKTIFWGRRDDVYALFQAMDVFVMTSTSEGLSVSFVEAQATGLPVVINSNLPVGNPLDLVTQKSLEASADSWAQQIILSAGIKRQSTSAQMSDHGYDGSALESAMVGILQTFWEDAFNETLSDKE